MKLIKIVIGTLALAFAVAQGVRLVGILREGTEDTYEASRIAAVVGAILIGAAICLALYRSAFKKKPPADA